MIIMAVVGGYNLPGISCLLLFVEVSTIFINFRSLYEKKDFGLMIPQVCQVLFFISFTLLRMVGLPIGLYILYVSTQVTWSHMNGMRQFCWAGAII